MRASIPAAGQRGIVVPAPVMCGQQVDLSWIDSGAITVWLTFIPMGMRLIPMDFRLLR